MRIWIYIWIFPLFGISEIRKTADQPHIKRHEYDPRGKGDPEPDYRHAACKVQDKKNDGRYASPEVEQQVHKKIR